MSRVAVNVLELNRHLPAVPRNQVECGIGDSILARDRRSELHRRGELRGISCRIRGRRRDPFRGISGRGQGERSRWFCGPVRVRRHRYRAEVGLALPVSGRIGLRARIGVDRVRTVRRLMKLSLTVVVVPELAEVTTG